MRCVLVAAVLVALSLVTSCSPSTSGAAPAGPGSVPPAPVHSVTVAGARLLGDDGRPVQLRGVNRSGTQYQCTSSSGAFDGPTDATAIDAIRSWGVNAVRVSLNEQCWLGVNGLPAAGSADDHRRAIAGFVHRLTAAGLVVVLDLHWNAPGAARAVDQAAMADRDHAPAFWRSVAGTFGRDPSVLFDLYNEPHPDTGTPDNAADQPATEAAWRCVRDGGTCPGVPFVAAGMQELVDAVRATGAANPILVAGPQFAGDVSRWLEFRPHDPLNRLVASIHVYGPAPDDTACSDERCWDATIAPLAEQVPVVIGEMGDMDCTGRVVTPLMDWADRHAVGYLAWAWVTSSCSDEPALIKNYRGDPTPYGAAVRSHLHGD